METKDILHELRIKNGLSQDDLAEKVYVTRQAVSRWENGETVPNTEALKLLSRLFDVSINTLLGSPRQLICQCCGMPLEDSIIGHNADGSLNEDYCKWCYADGTYTYSIGRSNLISPIYVAMMPVDDANIEMTATDEDGQHYAKSLSNITYAANNIYPLAMRMAESFKTYSTLPVGTHLNVGDQIDLLNEFNINGDVVNLEEMNEVYLEWVFV